MSLLTKFEEFLFDELTLTEEQEEKAIKLLSKMKMNEIAHLNNQKRVDKLNEELGWLKCPDLMEEN